MTWVLNSTRIKQTFLRPTSDNGVSAPRWHTGFRRFCVTAVWGFLFLAGFACEAAFTPAPKASVKALKITKGKPIDSGVVFVDGKFVDPPYVVERYGNVIRINGIQVSQPVVDWAEFLKTQPAVTVAKTESAPPPPVEEKAPEPEPEPEPDPEPAEAVELSSDDSGDDVLDDLFDDAPAKPKKAVHKAVAKAAPKPAPAPKPASVTKVKIESPFEMNDRARGLLSKVNISRRDTDAALRRGGFFCFGSSYSSITGDRRLAFQVMEKLPLVMKRCTELEPFAAGLRQAGLVYFTPRAVRDLFANRLDYLKLQKRYKKMKSNAELDDMLERAGASTF